MSIAEFIDQHFAAPPVGGTPPRDVRVCTSCNNSGWMPRHDPRLDQIRWQLCTPCPVYGLEVAA